MRRTPPSEINQRIAALQKLLGENNIDGALIADSADMFYFTGSAQRGYLFIPAAGNPLMAIKRSFTRAKEDSALTDIVSLGNIKALPALLAERGYTKLASLGLEMDVLPTSLYLNCQKIFSDTKLVDISGLIRNVRMIKSPYEIEILKDAAKLNCKMFSQVEGYLERYLKEGITELDLAGYLEGFSRSEGHAGRVRMRGFDQEVFYGHVLSGTNCSIPGCMESPTGGPGSSVSAPQGAGYKKIARDEVVFIDFVAVYDGYLADQSRAFCMGKLPDKLVKAHEVALEIQAAIQQKAKPGVLCEDMHKMALKMADESGFGAYFLGYPEPVVFVSHGVGIELNEWPVMALGIKVPLEKGMVMAVEPKFIFPEGAVGVENTFVVGDNGLEKLTVFNEGINYV